MVVDDNFESARTMGWMVEALGHVVCLAHDSASTFEVARGFLPDVVLLDIGLPGMDGYEVCRQMKKLPEMQKTIFIAQTGWGQKEHFQKSQDAGFHHHLVKPVSLQTLESILGTANNL